MKILHFFFFFFFTKQFMTENVAYAFVICPLGAATHFHQHKFKCKPVDSDKARSEGRWAEKQNNYATEQMTESV